MVKITCRVLLLALLNALSTSTSYGFALLGRFEPWQTPQLGYNALGQDIGAPKDLDEEYRWNVPVITYGFDRAFIDFFGDEGIQAVNQAFAVLNDLPRASELDLQTFGTDTRRVNLRAEAMNLLDVKSTVLSLLVEQLGLAPPERYVWTLRDRRVFSSGSQAVTNYLVINRNFDPTTLDQSAFINGGRYTYYVAEFPLPYSFADAVEQTVDPEHRIDEFGSVANFANGFLNGIPPGTYLGGLTADDAGGIRYLLHPLNINFEALPSDVMLANETTNSPGIIRDALRPGIEKLKFVCVSNAWETTPNWSMTVEWMDNFYLGGDVKHQQLKRIQRRPNIVISAADVGTADYGVTPIFFSRSTPNWKRVNGSSAAGPGILEGSVTITLAKLGISRLNEFPGYTTEAGSQVLPPPARWGSFDQTPVDPVLYPRRGLATALKIERRLSDSDDVLISVPPAEGSIFLIESSADLQHWGTTETILSATNKLHLECGNFRLRRLFPCQTFCPQVI